MATNTERPDSEAYKPLGGLIIALSDTGVEQTGMIPGAVYEFVAVGGSAVARWDTTTAAASDGGFTFFIPQNTPIRVRCPLGNTLLNVIEANADSTAAAVVLAVIVQPD